LGNGWFCLEIKLEANAVSLDDAADFIAGYRPWLFVYQPSNLDELKERKQPSRSGMKALLFFTVLARGRAGSWRFDIAESL
jgi:hypothetical protein